jgi:hypothetical protein
MQNCCKCENLKTNFYKLIDKFKELVKFLKELLILVIFMSFYYGSKLSYIFSLIDLYKKDEMGYFFVFLAFNLHDIVLRFYDFFD